MAASSRTRPPLGGGGGFDGEVGGSTALAKRTSKTQTVELSSQSKLPSSVCSALNTVAAFTCTGNPGTPASLQVYYYVE